jgi:2-acylglycerol O-acyltransferase 2
LLITQTLSDPVFSALLVPVLSFGENEAYDIVLTEKGSTSWKIQQWCKHTWGWSMPAYLGRGIFNYSFGVLPFRTPITTIVGTPIDPVVVWGSEINPDALSDHEFHKIVSKVHREYEQCLHHMHDRYKQELAPNRVSDLKVIE